MMQTNILLTNGHDHPGFVHKTFGNVGVMMPLLLLHKTVHLTVCSQKQSVECLLEENET
jgi:hypothetical protein